MGLWQTVTSIPARPGRGHGRRNTKVHDLRRGRPVKPPAAYFTEKDTRMNVVKEYKVLYAPYTEFNEKAAELVKKGFIPSPEFTISDFGGAMVFIQPFILYS